MVRVRLIMVMVGVKVSVRFRDTVRVKLGSGLGLGLGLGGFILVVNECLGCLLLDFFVRAVFFFCRLVVISLVFVHSSCSRNSRCSGWHPSINLLVQFYLASTVM